MSIEQRIARLAAPWVRELVPYSVENANGLTKLDAMENPFPLPQVLRESWSQMLESIEVNRYPDPMANALRAGLRAMHALDPRFEVVLGNGSDELIHMLCLAFARREGATMLCPEPSFAVYRLAAQAVGMNYVGVQLNAEDFSLDGVAMCAAIDEHQPALVFIASPNNPTANRLEGDQLAAICAAAPGVVVLDEAYYRFAGASRIEQLEAIENLIVMQTFSKVGLAGLRVGALFADKAWIDLLERVRMPYNISSLSQAGALFALEHDAEFQLQIDAIIAERAFLAQGLERVDGVHVWPSETNFILVRIAGGRGKATFEALREHGVLVKNLSGGHPALADCLRITVGTRAENQLLLRALGTIVRRSVQGK